jgi:hypothetical protein
MKAGKIMLMAGLCLAGYTAAFSQQNLPEVIVMAANYKYLKTVGGKEVPVAAQRLQRAAASYDIKNSEYYEEDYDTYFISFALPEGQVLAAYDANGKLLRTAEHYHNVALPSTVSQAVATKFPNWAITRDVYLVNYFEQNGSAVKKYKLVLENGNKRIRVQVSEDGELS